MKSSQEDRGPGWKEKVSKPQNFEVSELLSLEASKLQTQVRNYGRPIESGAKCGATNAAKDDE